MWDHRHKKPGMLSGGQRQRCSVARAFAVAPTVLLLDEPFGAVDALTKRTLHRELIELRSMAKSTGTVVMVTHDIVRPRVVTDVLHSSIYAELRDHLLALLGDDTVAAPIGVPAL